MTVFINGAFECSAEDAFPLRTTDAPVGDPANGETFDFCWHRTILATTAVTLTAPATTSANGLTYTFDHWDTSGQSATCSEGNATTACPFIVPSFIAPLQTGLNLTAIYTTGDTTDPTVTIVSPTATTYLLNQSVAASFACTDAGGPRPARDPF